MHALGGQIRERDKICLLSERFNQTAEKYPFNQSFVCRYINAPRGLYTPSLMVIGIKVRKRQMSKLVIHWSLVCLIEVISFMIIIT